MWKYPIIGSMYYTLRDLSSDKLYPLPTVFLSNFIATYFDFQCIIQQMINCFFQAYLTTLSLYSYTYATLQGWLLWISHVLKKLHGGCFYANEVAVTHNHKQTTHNTSFNTVLF